MQVTQDAPMTEKDPEIKIDLNENLGEGLQNGFDAIGKAFGGLVGAIKDAVGPELMKNLEVANWLGRLAECLEKISDGLHSDGSVPAAQAGQFSFYVDLFDATLDGSKLEAQKPAFQQHLNRCQQALKNPVTDAPLAAATLAQSAGYFKAAAASCVPVQANASDSDSKASGE